MRLHASCAALDGAGVVLIGAPGSGKSDLLLRLIDAGFDLVADDQVDVVHGTASAPDRLQGLIEVRGLGIQRLPFIKAATVALAVDMDDRRAERLPTPRMHPMLDVPWVGIDPATPSAVARVRVALGCACGGVGQVAGAFAL